MATTKRNRKYRRVRRPVKGHKRNDPRINKKVDVKSYTRSQKMRVYRKIPRAQAKEEFNKRPQRARTLDKKNRSKDVKEEPDEEWSEHPNKSDVEGIDTPDAWMYDWEQKAKQQEQMEKVNPSKLPPLKGDEKYYIIALKEGYASYITYATSKESAIDKYKENSELFKKIRPDKTIEIIVATNMDEVREKLYNRGKEDYLITGDTYPNRKKIHQIARVKFDYDEKGYRGKLSPDEVAKIKTIPGLKIEKTTPFTSEEVKESEIARLESKQNKFIKPRKGKNEIWQQENPFTKEQEERFHSLTWIFDVSGKEDKLNSYFQQMVSSKEAQIKRSLGIDNIKEASPKVQDALDRYKEETYNYVLSELREHETAPSMAVTGPSKYSGNFEKRERMERKRREEMKRIESNVDKVIRLEREKIRLENISEYKAIDFGPRNSKINAKMRSYRKKYPNLDIYQNTSSQTRAGKSKWYIVKNTKTDKTISFKIDEDGKLAMGKGHFPTEYSKTYTNENDFYQEFNRALAKFNSSQ